MQKTTPIHIKSIREIRNSSFLPKNEKSNIHQNNSQHHTKWKGTQSNPLKRQGPTYSK